MMGKLKTVLKYVKNMDFKNMLVIVKKVSKKSHKPSIIIFFDMVYCGLVYGAGYYDYQEFEFYLLKRKIRKTYLTRAKNNLIVKTYNNKEYFHCFSNKATFNEIFKDFIKRDYLVINKDNYADFKKFTKKHQVLIVKPIDGFGGRGVEKVVIEKSTDIMALFKRLLAQEQVLVEECIKQHHELSELHPKSVNTLRMFTFFDGKESHVLNSSLKLGNGGVTDNWSDGMMYTILDEDGVAMVPALDKNDDTHEVHPLTKKKILGFKVPFYNEVCETVKKAAKLVPEVKYVGWDVAITEDSPVIIEGNEFPGVWQIKPSLYSNPIGLIPKYQKVMKIK